MTAPDRLAAAIDRAVFPLKEGEAAEEATAILAADPTLAQDIADGQALREAQSRLDPGELLTVMLGPTGAIVGIADHLGNVDDSRSGATIADACRKALEARS